MYGHHFDKPFKKEIKKKSKKKFSFTLMKRIHQLLYITSF